MVLDCHPSHWRYLGEGGANIVFEYLGGDVDLKDKVLRIRKFLPSSNHHFSIATAQKYCIDAYVDECVQVAVSKDFVEQLVQQSEPYRPLGRLFRPIHIHEQAFLLPNYHAPLEGADEFVSLEIKPKWHGALSLFQDLDSTLSAAHLRYCRYCAHNYSNETGFGVDVKYCPSDLFSGKRDRICRALDGLCQEPRNNLKVFTMGQPMDPARLSSKVRNVAAELLTRDPLLSHLQAALIKSWTFAQKANPNSIQEHKTLIEAVALRDCSAIIRLGFSKGASETNVVSSIHVIDLDEKSSEKLSLYQSELELFRLHCKDIRDTLYLANK